MDSFIIEPKTQTGTTKMRVLITCPRAPVSIEWIKIALRCGHEAVIVDSLDYPIGSFYPNIDYIKIPSPKIDFDGYFRAMEALIETFDLIIPNCEDLFYLSKVRDAITTKASFFMPESTLLFELHNKYRFFDRLNSHVSFPTTRLITSKEQIDFESKTILKPVYSRFGRSVVRTITKNTVVPLEISVETPWVQQAYISGEPLCNYAICHYGEVIAHSVYRPKYLLNQAASTYFEYHEDKRCEAFITEFARSNRYHGQVAFDFIDDGKDLYVLECNPRATSGLHIISQALDLDITATIICNRPIIPHSYRVGSTLYLLFGIQALLHGKFLHLHHDYKRAIDTLKPLPWYSQFFALYEMIKRSLHFQKPLTSASTFDIEYDGEKNV